MFSTYEITRALVAERQSTLQSEARQHRLGRLGRAGRQARRTRRASQADRPTPSPAPEVRPVPATPARRELPPAAALAAWQHDQRAA